MTVWAFAQLIGANPKTVYYWMYGQVIPELVYAYKIEMATEGGVSMVSWLGTELAKMQWEHNHSDIENELEMRRRSNKKYYQKKQRERYTPDGTDPQED